MTELAESIQQLEHTPSSQTLLGMRFDAVNQHDVLNILAERSSTVQFGYVVTPNVQHVVDTHRNVARKELFDNALLCVCDSQPVRALAFFLGGAPSLVTGADLTVAMFKQVIEDGDAIATICASEELARLLQEQYPKLQWHFHIPPEDTEVGTPAFNDCVKFIAETPARFSFVCIGAPKSEEICNAVLATKAATGTAICTGAALEFLVGLKTRAPRIFQIYGMEWVHRVFTEPRRLWRRYTVAVPTLLKLFIIDLANKWLPSRNNH